MQWPCDVGEAFNERAVKIEKAYCPSHFCDVFGCWPRVYARDFYWVHACHPLFKDYPQVIHGRRMECAFLRFEVKVMIKGYLEDVLNGRYVSCHISSCCNTNVVHVNSYSGSPEFMFEDDVSEDVVHHGLEGCRGVGESEVHDGGFEESVPCFERRFAFVSFSDTYVVISPPDVQFRVYVGITEVSYKVRDEWQWILIAYGDCVDFSVILYQS